MFLTKKNTNYFNKPKHLDPTKPKRILGGMLIYIQVGKTILSNRMIKSTIQKNNKINVFSLSLPIYLKDKSLKTCQKSLTKR